VRGVGIGEEQVQLPLAELLADRVRLLPDLRLELLVVGRKLSQLDEVAPAALQPGPELDLLPEGRGLLGQLSRALRLVPDARLG